MKRLITLSRRISIIAALVLVGYLGFVNTTPFTIRIHYAPGDQHILPLGPSSRVSVNNVATKQLSDLVYFNNAMVFAFNQANITLAFRNISQQQEIDLGYRDQDIWHYKTTVLDSLFMDEVSWPKVSSNGLYLYQKNPTYKSVSDFLRRLPQDKIIGTYDYDLAGQQKTDGSLPGYRPAQHDTIINTPLRGKTAFYTYVSNEPFHMTFTKQDLNWYPDPDVVNIKVYKDNDVVAQASIDDDNNNSGNHVVGPPQQVTINNPGPGLPEAGVYKVVIDASPDSVITQIQTNLHKIVFEGPLLPVGNVATYGGLVQNTTPTTLYTNIPTVSAQTYHSATQSIQVGSQTVSITSGQAAVYTPTGATNNYVVPVTEPNSDVVLNGVGYFSFTADQFFTPTPYKILPLADKTDLGQVDYILTDYPGPPKKEGDWQVATRRFDLSQAVTQKGELSWTVQAPGLKENNRDIEIKSIDMTLTKKGWFSK